MGWALVVRIEEIWTNLSTTAILFLVSGGISYTIGAVVYATKKPRLFEPIFGFHELWHLFVLLGFVFHYLLVLSFYL